METNKAVIGKTSFCKHDVGYSLNIAIENAHAGFSTASKVGAGNFVDIVIYGLTPAQMIELSANIFNTAVEIQSNPE